MRVLVTDLLGKTLFEQNYGPQADPMLWLNLNHLPTGMYMVNLITQNANYPAKVLIAK